jgi:ribosomal protein L34E
MKRIANCQACNFLIAGIKTRKALKHTCGKSTEEIMKLRSRVFTQDKAIKKQLKQNYPNPFN